MNKDEFENKTLDENDFREVVAENNQVIDNVRTARQVRHQHGCGSLY